jgi:hypothetical protein
MKKHVLRLATLAACTGLVFGTVNASFAQIAKYGDTKFKADAELRQLESKPAARSAASTRAAKATSGPTKVDLLQIQNGYVVIDATSNEADGHQLLLQLQKLGLKSGSVYGRVVSGLFPINKVDQLERVETLHFAAPSYRPMHHVGLTTSQGDASLLADKARATYNLSGAGAKVGVMSDSYGSIAGGPAAGVASGDLPAGVEVLADVEDGTDEGRGMAEIVHDVAPGAKIAFHTANLGQAGFASGIGKLADAGCNIVVDDVAYFAEPFFQDGIIAQAVDQVVARNVSYFSSAGNQARQSYQAGFKNSGKSVIFGGVNYGVAHDFGNGDIMQTVRLPANSTVLLSFQWADPFFSVSGGKGAQTDLDVLVFYNGALLTDLSSLDNNIGGDPVEFIGVQVGSTAANIELVIVKAAGPDPQLMKYVNFGSSTAGPTEYITNSSTVVGHANATGAVAVAASPWYNTPVFNTNITRPVVEPFSSQGGTPVFITKEGANTGYDESKIRRKPVVTGPDGGNTSFFGSDISLDTDNYPNFFGTSASAPHVAAVAALMQEAARNSLTPTGITDILTSTAQDMDDPFTAGFDTGFDFRTGYGFVQADKAVMATGGPCLTDTEAPKVLAAGLTIALDNNGTRTIEAADIDYGSTDNCGIASITLDKTTFTCANLGNNEVTLTVTDFRGNVSKQTVTVVVVDKTAPTVLAAGLEVRLLNGTRTIEAADIDYGSTDNCGIASITLDKTTFTCANVGTNQVTLTVTDRSGNVAKQTVEVVVLADATCGTIALGADKQLDAYPNPAADQATVAFRATQAGSAQVKVFDQMGTLVATLYNGAVEGDHVYSVTLDGRSLPNGVYNCQLVTNGKVVNQRLLITK